MRKRRSWATASPFSPSAWICLSPRSAGAAHGIERVRTLSDHRDAAFGKAYGVLIKELRLLARAVFVVDSGGTVRYVQLVKETSHEPDYRAVLDAVADCR